MRIRLGDYSSAKSKISLLAKLARKKILIFTYLFIHSFQKAEFYHIFLHTHFGKSQENFFALSSYLLCKHGKLMNSIKGKFISNQDFTKQAQLISFLHGNSYTVFILESSEKISKPEFVFFSSTSGICSVHLPLHVMRVCYENFLCSCCQCTCPVLEQFCSRPCHREEEHGHLLQHSNIMMQGLCFSEGASGFCSYYIVKVRFFMFVPCGLHPFQGNQQSCEESY